MTTHSPLVFTRIGRLSICRIRQTQKPVYLFDPQNEHVKLQKCTYTNTPTSDYGLTIQSRNTPHQTNIIWIINNHPEQ
ncbi:MAG: hypothetical protein LBH74_00920 [Nitrososphaerota archaeon]|jgi:hypothetical protein|nr:hypothetical protein [Nitrososphaerota archaeon]